MNRFEIRFRLLPLVVLLAVGCAGPDDAPENEMAAGETGADTPEAATDAQAMLDHLLFQTSQVEDKLVGLAEAIPEEDYGWRPMEGVRSVSEVFQHVAADNYLIPAIGGVAAPDSTGILLEDYATVQAFETEAIGKAEVIAKLQASFVHLYDAVEQTRSDLDATYEGFGTEFTGGSLWTLAVTHLHEHLGQAIAYARSNEVVPPWSQ